MTAALVTPDRGLARRVIAELARWDVPVDDSGGDALAIRRPDVLARLAAEAALDGLVPSHAARLLKHPLLRLGLDDEGHGARSRGARARGAARPPAAPGTAGLAQALTSFRAELAKLRNRQSSDLHPSDPRTTLTERDLDDAADLVARLIAALAPLEDGPRSTAAL